MSFPTVYYITQVIPSCYSAGYAMCVCVSFGACVYRSLGWIDRVWSSKECVCCACDPCVHLDTPSICFVCVFVCRKLSLHLRELDHMCALLVCFYLVILHTMWSGKSLSLQCILPFVCRQYDVCKNMLAVYMLLCMVV